jgi:excisionase family DNA binding protein
MTAAKEKSRRDCTPKRLSKSGPFPLREKDMTTEPLYGPSEFPAISLRPRQAAQALSISLSTLDRLTRSGAIPVIRQGRIRLYSIAALKEWLRMKGGDHGQT